MKKKLSHNSVTVTLNSDGLMTETRFPSIQSGARFPPTPCSDWSFALSHKSYSVKTLLGKKKKLFLF